MVSVALRQGLIDPGYTIIFRKQCSVTKEPYEVAITAKQFGAWVGGQLIQNAMPYLTAEQREFLMSGATPAEWDAMWADPEED